jgi:uncharacterized protein (TIGR00369 family)|tara:strand:+ start:147 stop:539 length:393 start_codon:yes stop_codon:yes gene_type:complete
MVKKYMDETKKGFMQNIGDLSFKKIDETNYEFNIKVEEKFLNTGKIAHGGFIATIADTGMGNAAHIAAGNKRSVTVNLDIKYISAGKLGDNLVGKVEVLKRTKTLVFINCKILNSKGIVATASGTWKILL